MHGAQQDKLRQEMGGKTGSRGLGGAGDTQCPPQLLFRDSVHGILSPRGARGHAQWVMVHRARAVASPSAPWCVALPDPKVGEDRSAPWGSFTAHRPPCLAPLPGEEQLVIALPGRLQEKWPTRPASASFPAIFRSHPNCWQCPAAQPSSFWVPSKVPGGRRSHLGLLRSAIS